MIKRLLLIGIFLIGYSSLFFAQHQNRRPPLEKIEQLERAKLIEILDMKEDVAVRFFARRKEFRDGQRDLIHQREQLVDKIEKKLNDKSFANDKEYKDQMNDILTLESKLFESKRKFYSSLSDILSPEQILKLAIFDYRFMREIRQILSGRRKGNEG